MIGSKMASMQPSRSQIKKQLDDVLEADYQLLRCSHNQADDILRLKLVHRTPLIKQYMEQLEHQYNIPSPLKQQQYQSISIGKNKRLGTNIRNSAQKPRPNPKEFKPKQRLTLFSNQKHSCKSLINQLEGPISVQQKETHTRRQSVNTPKFYKPAQEKPIEGIVSSEGVINKAREAIISSDESQRINYIQWKQKPNLGYQSNVIFSYMDSCPVTPKKKSSIQRPQGQYNELSLLSSYKDTPEKPTAKKEPQQFRVDSESSVCQFNSRHTIFHKNPASAKMASRVTTEAPQLQIQDSYRYCVACEDAILSANIKYHESMCQKFQEFSLLSNEDLILRLRQKVARLQDKIPKKSYQVNPQQVEQLRRNSINLVEQSKKRPKGSTESPRFVENYSNVIKLGHKWCSALEEINKLRWFTRILQKLELMFQQHVQ